MRDYLRRANLSRAFGVVCTALVLFFFGLGQAKAVPAYAAQTGQNCSSCHVGGFGPQLTPFGRAFKLSGYTLRGGDDRVVPLSAMLVASYVHTAEDQPPLPHYAANDNFALDQASIFAAGHIGDHFGGLAQFTYDGIGRAFAWDNLDVRIVDRVRLLGSETIIGVILNNSPTVQDPWNTLAAWGFPFTGSDLVPSPAAAPVLAGGLAQSVVGTSAYVWWRSSVYAEAGVYWTPSRGFLRAMGVDANESGVLTDAAPYFRIGYEKDYAAQNFEIGAIAFFPDIYPGGDRSAGAGDHYSDLGLDASYQFTGSGENIYQVDVRYTHERQTFDASYVLDEASNLHNTLEDFRTTLAYYWHNEVGASVNYFVTWGTADLILFVDNRIAKPDSSGFTFQLDFTPFGNEPSTLGPRANLRSESGLCSCQAEPAVQDPFAA